MDNSNSKIDRAFEDLAALVSQPPHGLDTNAIVRAATAYANHNVAPVISTQSRIARRAWITSSIFALTSVAAITFVSTKYFVPADPPAATTYTTENGQRARITLPDGSTAILAPVTTLRASGVGGRDIILSGEAIFTVIQQNSTPFIVRTGGTVTRVLGTRFGIRAYDKQIRVAVAEGRVSVGNSTLSAHDVAFIKSGTVLIQRNTDVDAFLSFASGQLSFNNQSLADVIGDLQRWYDVEIRLANPSLATRKVDGTFPGKSISELAQTLEFILDVRVVRDGRVITLGEK